MPSATDILNTYFDTTIEDLIKSYEQKGLRASGKYAQSLVKEIRQEGTHTIAKIKGASHVYFLQHGRGPNKVQTHQAVKNLGWHLQKWVRDKGIDVNPYAAAHKIVHEGIKVPNSHNPGGVVSDVINSEWLKEIVNLLRFDTIETAKSEVLKEFKK